jgi:hypothetical protein
MIPITDSERARLKALFLRMAEHPGEYRPRTSATAKLRAQRKRSREIYQGQLLSDSRFDALVDDGGTRFSPIAFFHNLDRRERDRRRSLALTEEITS